MADLKREYVVPLRRKTRFAPRWRRSKKAVSVLNEFMRKHMKTDDIVICSELNEFIWKDGAKNPPGKVSVSAIKTKVGDKELTIVNLSDVGVDKQLETYKAAQNAKVAAVKEAAPKAEAKADSKEEVKEAEVKEVKKEAKSEKKETKKEEVKNG